MTNTDELLKQATPRPWRRGTVRGYGIYGEHRDQSALATVRHWESAKVPEDERAAADASLIVLAVNDFERLRRIENAARRVMQLLHIEAVSFEDPTAATLGAVGDLRRALEAPRVAD